METLARLIGFSIGLLTLMTAILVGNETSVFWYFASALIGLGTMLYSGFALERKD